MAQDLRFALRMILSHRWFSAAVVAILALGIGLNTMVFTLIDAALFKPVPVPGGERLVSILDRKLTSVGQDTLQVSYPDFRAYRAQASTLQGLEAGDRDQGILSEHGNPPQAYAMQLVSSGLFQMLHTPPVLGRDFRATDDQPGAEPVVMLSYGVWKERYGSSPLVIGRPVRVNEKPATIIGVMPKGFQFPSNTEIWMGLSPTEAIESRVHPQLHLFGMLKPGVRIAEASTELNGIAQRLAKQNPDTNKDVGVSVETFQERYNGGNIRMIFLLMLAAVGFVLLIACANVANMMLSRALTRQREMSIRTALGASRWRVMQQVLIESVVLSVFGGLLGLGLAAIGVHWFTLATENVGKPYWVQFHMDYAVFGYFAGLCILSGLVFGSAPALRFSQVNLNEVLKEGARGAGGVRGGWLSGVLVVLQFGLTLVLLVGAGVFTNSLLASLSINRDVPAEALMTARLDLPEQHYKDADARQRFYDQLLPKLLTIPGVTHAALTSNPPGMDAATQDMEIEHSAEVSAASRPKVSLVAQSPEYLATIGLPLLAGRSFNEVDGTANHKVAILTRECAQHFWPNQTAIGKRFRLYDDSHAASDWITVVGIAANIVQESDEQTPKPLLFVPVRQEGWNGLALLVRSSENPAALVRAAVQSLDQDLPLREVSMLKEAVEHRQWYMRLFGKVFAGFALIALLMASVGIYAVIAQAAVRRTQEIGVRMALGASASDVIGLVMTRGLWQIGAGLLLGLALAVPASRAMASLPLAVSATDPDVFLVVGAMLVAVGLFACWLPAHRAAMLDPVKALRYE